VVWLGLLITRPKVWCDDGDFGKEDLKDSRKQVLNNERWESLAQEEETVSFSVKEGVSISDHINNYTKFLADLANMNVDIDDKDKVLITLSSLPDEGYKTFVLTLINGRTLLSYSKITTTLVNLELRQKGKV